MSGLSDEVRETWAQALYESFEWSGCAGSAWSQRSAESREKWRQNADYFAPLIHQAEARGAAAVVERVEAACAKAELLTQESMGHRSEHWRGIDYADGLDAGIEVTATLVRDAAALTTEAGTP